MRQACPVAERTLAQDASMQDKVSMAENLTGMTPYEKNVCTLIISNEALRKHLLFTATSFFGGRRHIHKVMILALSAKSKCNDV